MAFIFVPLLAMTAIAFFFVWVYLAHSFTLVIEETAAGNDEVVWPDDPLYDWIWKGGYLLWVVGVWVFPAIVVARIATRRLDLDLNVGPWTMTPEEQRWAIMITVASVVFWLFFPLSLLSTMSAESRWAVLHGPLFLRLGKNMASLLLFYAISAVLIIICAPLLFKLCRGSDIFTLILGGVGLSAAMMVIARLLGRVANRARLTYIRPRKKGGKSKPPAAIRERTNVSDPWEVPEDAPELPEPPPPRFVQPSELPAIQTPYEGDVVGYDVRFDDRPRAERQPRRRSAFEEGESLPMQHEESPTDERRRADEQNDRKRLTQAIVPDRIEVDRLTRKRARPARTEITRGVAGFLFQKGVSVHWLTIALGICLLGLLIRGLQAFWPM